MPMTAQNGAHGCDCGKVKVTLLNKRNAAEALTAPLNSEFFSSYQRAKVRRDVGSNGGTHGHASSYQSSAIQLRFAKNKFLTAPEICATMVMQMESSICTHSEYVTAKGTGGFTVRFLFLLFSKTFKKVLTNSKHGVIMLSNPNDRRQRYEMV